MVRIQRLTGCRPAEICILRPADSRSLRVHLVVHAEPAQDRAPWSQPADPDWSSGSGDSAAVPAPRTPRPTASRPTRQSRSRRAENHAARVTPMSCGNRPGTNRRASANDGSPASCYTTDSYRRAIHRACTKAGVAAVEPQPAPARRGDRSAEAVRPRSRPDPPGSHVGERHSGVRRTRHGQGGRDRPGDRVEG